MDSQSLRNLIPLVQRRETLQAEMHKLETDIQLVVDGKPTIPMPILHTADGRQTGVGIRIKAMLQDAGAEGMTVADVAVRLGKKKDKVQQWFYQQTNNAPWLRKIGLG